MDAQTDPSLDLARRMIIYTITIDLLNRVDERTGLQVLSRAILLNDQHALMLFASQHCTHIGAPCFGIHCAECPARQPQTQLPRDPARGSLRNRK